MRRVRADALQRVVQRAAAQGAVVLCGDHGSGRTSLLDGLQEAAPARLVHLTRLDVDDPLDAWAAVLGRPVGSVPGPAEVAQALDGVVLAIDDAQWFGAAPADGLVPLVGSTALVVTVAVEEPGAHELITALEAAGAEVVELGALGPEAAGAVLTEGGVPAGDQPARAALAGGNLALLSSALTDDPAALAPQVRDGLAARLHAAGPAGRQAAATLHLAGGSAPAACLPSEGLAALVDARWATSTGAAATLVQGALGLAAAAACSPEEQQALHRALADHVPAVERPHHLEAAGCLEAAADAAADALEGATLTEAPALLELVRRARGADPDVEARLAAALLAAGRASAAIEPAGAAGAVDLLAAALRQCGRAGEAAAALEGAPPETGAREAVELARWPGMDLAGAGPEVAAADPSSVRLRPLDELLTGAAAVPALLAAAADAATAEAWDDTGRLAAAAVLAAAVLEPVATGSSALRAAVLLAPAPPGPWHALVAVAERVHDQHALGSSAALGEAIAALVDVDHALPGAAAAHLALVASDLGRASDALAILDAAPAGGRVPQAWDRELLDWARAEVELTAGRPRRARQVLGAGPVGRAGAAARLLAGLRTGTAGWVARELGEAPPDGTDLPAPVAAELRGHAAHLAVRHADAAQAYDEAAAAWPSRRAAARARWAAAEARRATGELDLAVASLRAIETEAEVAGWLPLLARARQSLRRAGVRTRPARRAEPGPSPSGAPSGDGPVGSLSPRERQVLELVGQGLPSGEIAERLGVGRATVESQVSSAMRKLGARTRRQAAAVLAEASP